MVRVGLVSEKLGSRDALHAANGLGVFFIWISLSSLISFFHFYFGMDIEDILKKAFHE